MIELLIQLVIILIVVASIIKRMQDAAKKGEELGKPPPQSPLGGEKQKPILAEKIQDWSKQEELGKSPPQQPLGDKKPTLAERIQDWSKQFEMQLETPEPRERPGEDIESFEQTHKEEFDGMVSEEAEKLPEEIQIAPSPPPYSAPLITHKPPIQLHFSGSDLIKGIIMSEILGQPVGLRGD